MKTIAILCIDCTEHLPTDHEEETYDAIGDTNSRSPPPVPATASPNFFATDSKLDCAICKCFKKVFEI